MSNLSRITLIGNCGTDPEFVAFESGAMLTKFTLAVGRYDKKKGEDVTDWFDVETFSKLGEYVKKGLKLCVDGRMITNVWKKDDGKFAKNYIVQANTIEILTKKENSENSSQSEKKSQKSEVKKEKTENFDEPMIDDEEIPF